MARILREPNWGEIYLTKFDPAFGSEIQKTRPALVIQNNINNMLLPTTIVAAITSRKSQTTFATSVPLKKGDGGLEHDSLILTTQIRTVDTSRLGKKLGSLSAAQMYQVGKALSLSLGYAGL